VVGDVDGGRPLRPSSAEATIHRRVTRVDQPPRHLPRRCARSRADSRRGSRAPCGQATTQLGSWSGPRFLQRSHAVAFWRHGCLLAPGCSRSSTRHLERVHVDVACRGSSRRTPRSRCTSPRSGSRGSPAVDRADGTTDHAERVAALAARGRDQVFCRSAAPRARAASRRRGRSRTPGRRGRIACSGPGRGGGDFGPPSALG